MRGKLTYRQSQYLTCFKRPNATLTCKVQHTKHILRRRMCSSIHTSGEFGIALIKSMGRGEHARKARVAGCCPCCRGILEQQRWSSSDQPTTPIGLRTPRCFLSTVSLRVKRRSLARPRRAADCRSSRQLSYLLPRDSSPPLVMNSLRGCSLPKHACLEQSGGRSRVVHHKHGRGLCVIDAAVNGFAEPCSHRGCQVNWHHHKLPIDHPKGVAASPLNHHLPTDHPERGGPSLGSSCLAVELSWFKDARSASRVSQASRAPDHEGAMSTLLPAARV